MVRVEKRWRKIFRTCWVKKQLLSLDDFIWLCFVSRLRVMQSIKKKKNSHICACSYCIQICEPIILTATLGPVSLDNFAEGMPIHFGQSSLMGHHLCAAGLFSVRGGIFLRRYCCLRSSDWMAVRIKKIRSDVMSCGMLSSTASLSEEAWNMTASAVTLGHVGAWEPLCHRAKIANMLRVEQFAPSPPSHYSWGFLFFFSK